MCKPNKEQRSHPCGGTSVMSSYLRILYVAQNTMTITIVLNMTTGASCFKFMVLLYCDKINEEDSMISGPRNHERDEEDQGDEGDESSEDLEESVEDTEQSDLKFLQAIIQFFQHMISSASKVINIVGITVNIYTTTYYDKQPYHTSILTGVGWVNKLLNGHPEWI